MKSKLLSVAQALKQPVSWQLLGLGFSAGLPFLLVGGTLGFWLRQEGISLTLIAFSSWVSLVYGLKILWAPWMDRLRLPFLYDLMGQRRSFMVLSQICVALGLVGMAIIGPKASLTPFLVMTFFVAFAAASQEIAIDAWRVEQTSSQADQALNPSFYAYGFRIAILMTDALVLVLSKRMGWPLSYQVIAGFMLIGILTTFACARPKHEGQVKPQTKAWSALIVEPVISFFTEHGKGAGLILLTLALYRLPDYLIGPVAGPLYQDTGLDADAIAAMRASVGLWASIIGITAGASCLLFFGLKHAFILGALLGPLSNLCFSWMAVAGGDLRVFGLTLIVDNFSNGIAETALVAFMTYVTQGTKSGREYTLTHYALMYSVAAFTGKFLKGFSGMVIDKIEPIFGLFGGYQAFFIGTALLAIPCIVACLFLDKKGIFGLKLYNTP